MRNGRLAPAVAIAVAWAAVAGKLLVSGYLGGMQDDWVHTLWAQQFLTSLAEGQWYPRWTPATNFGFGSPSLSFYPPFSFYTYAVLGVFTEDVGRMVALSSALSVLASGAAMYAYARVFAGRGLATLSAVVYMALPYHAYSIYEKGALGEQWAYAWLPLVFLFLHRARPGATRATAGLAVSYAGLVLTHLPTLVLASPFALGYAESLDGVRSDKGGRPLFWYRLAAMGGGVALSSFYFLPVVFERRFINPEGVLFDPFFYPWTNYLFAPGKGSPVLHPSLAAAAGAAVLAVMLAAYLVLRRAGRVSETDRIVPSMLVLGLAALVLMTPLASPAWRYIGVLRNLQFPTRLMVVLDVLCAAGIAWAIGAAARCESRAAARALVASAAIVLAMAGVFAAREVRGYRPPVPPATGPVVPGMSHGDLTASVLAHFPDDITALIDAAGEYNPVWATFDIDKHKDEVLRMERTTGYTDLGDSPGSVRVLRWGAESRTLETNLPGSALLTVRTYYHPYWEARAGGPALRTAPGEGTGFLTVEVPAGRSTVELRYTKGPWFTAGIALSLATALALGAWVGWRRKRDG